MDKFQKVIALNPCAYISLCPLPRTLEETPKAFSSYNVSSVQGW